MREPFLSFGTLGQMDEADVEDEPDRHVVLRRAARAVALLMLCGRIKRKWILEQGNVCSGYTSIGMIAGRRPSWR
jgi:hypothetical protein